MKPRTKQSVKSLLMSDHEIRDLSNQSFRFNDLYHEAVLCVAFSSNGEEVIAGGNSGNVKVFNLKVSLVKMDIIGACNQLFSCFML